MTQMTNDEGLTVLRQVYDQMNSTLPWSLIETCYRIQLKHQFESDREIAVSQIKQAVSEVVSQIVSANEDKNAL